MTLLVHEPVGGKVSEHQVLLAFGNAATVHLGPLKDGVFRTEPAIAFSGRLTVEGSGSPVPNAGIVVSDYPWQYETKTDATGRFSLSGVRGGGTVAIFVDASLSGVGASAVKTHVFRDMAASDLVELVLPSVQAPPDPKMIAAIPEPPPSVGDGCTPHNDPQYGVVTSRLFWDEKNVEVDPASYSVIATKPNPPVITLTACVDPSKWTVWSAYSAFDVNTGQATDKKAPPSPDFCPAACKGSKACMQYKVALKPLQPNLARVAIEFKNPKGYSVGKGIEITFSPPGPYALDYDPTPLLTDQEGKIILCDVSVNPVRVFYQGPQGHTDCDVTLGKQGTVVLDGKCIAAASPENQGATR
jgi:hypothetical protein